MSEDSKLKIKSRGIDPKDKRFFCSEEVKRLKVAVEEIIWLLNRGYHIKSILELVGGRYQFSSRQRIALQRSVCTDEQLENRVNKELKSIELKDRSIYIDGFILIILLEVAFSSGLLIKCRDGAIRDLAGLRGTYRLIDKTDIVLNLLGKVFYDLKVNNVIFYLDSPVSNSGKLKSRILEVSEKWTTEINVEIVQNPDTILEKMDFVISSDSIILDKCNSWFNLSRYIIDNYIKAIKIINLN